MPWQWVGVLVIPHPPVVISNSALPPIILLVLDGLPPILDLEGGIKLQSTAARLLISSRISWKRASTSMSDIVAGSDCSTKNVGGRNIFTCGWLSKN